MAVERKGKTRIAGGVKDRGGQKRKSKSTGREGKAERMHQERKAGRMHQERKAGRMNQERRAGDMPLERKAERGYQEKMPWAARGKKERAEKELWPPGNLLYPLPVVLVSCQRPGGQPHIITVAWAGTVCSSPAMVSISVRKERYSYGILKETREFVVNLVTEDLVFAADHCGVKSGQDEDKYKELGLTPQPSRKIAAPGIEESPVNIECKVERILRLGSHDMFIAQVLGVTVDRRHMDAAGKFHLNDTGLVAYSHGEYLALGERLGKFGYSVQKSGKGRG